MAARRAPAPATRRVNRGRGHSYTLDGTKADGVTTLINGGVPKPALTAWAARTVAELVAERREILTQLSDEEIVDLLKGAPFRDRDKAANRGTEVHRLAAQFGSSGGAEVEVPDELVGMVDSYLHWRGVWRPSAELVEVTVISRKHRYMGTLDLIATLPVLGRTLLDFKTGKSGVFGEVALQLAAYGNAETYLEERRTGPRDVTYVEVPMPRIDSYAALWLTPDGWEFYPIDCGEREFRTFLFAAETARWVWARTGDKATEPVKGAAYGHPPAQPLEVVK